MARQKGGRAEGWKSGRAEERKSRTAERRKGGRAEGRKGGRVERRNGTAEGRQGGTAEWHGRRAEWRNGRNGRRAEGQYSYIPNLPDIFKVHTDTNDNTDTLIFYSIDYLWVTYFVSSTCEINLIWCSVNFDY